MELSDKIRILRKARGFSQEGLGDSLSRVSKDGISRQSVSDWENGKSEPKLDNIRDLACVLKVSFDALLDENIDLDNKAVLARVLNNVSTKVKEDVNSKFRYTLYASTLSVKSFKCPIVAVCILFATILLSVLSILLGWGTALLYIIPLGGGMFIGLLPISIMELTRISKGKVRTNIGELNNTHLIIQVYKEEVHNTLYIPLEQITKIELGDAQKKNCGEVLIWITGRNRAITINKLQNPKKLIEIFQKLSEDSAMIVIPLVV